LNEIFKNSKQALVAPLGRVLIPLELVFFDLGVALISQLEWLGSQMKY